MIAVPLKEMLCGTRTALHLIIQPIEITNGYVVLQELLDE